MNRFSTIPLYVGLSNMYCNPIQPIKKAVDIIELS